MIDLATFGPNGTCISTHGGSGYASGSYWDDGAIVCGICGYRIENPHPTGEVWISTKGLMNELRGLGKWVGTYPDFIKPQKT